MFYTDLAKMQLTNSLKQRGYGARPLRMACIPMVAYMAVLAWWTRRHPNKNVAWIRKTYFHKQYLNNWIFFGTRIKGMATKR